MENELLKIFRHKRNFNVDYYIKRKIKLINQFFRDQHLDAAVVGLSGGVDSAVTILLLKKASEEENSPIKKIMGIIAPIDGHGTTGQDKAVYRAELLVKKHKLDYKLVDLSRAYVSIVGVFDSKDNDAWSEGQMASVLRTPAFYYQAALLQNQGFKSLVVGTTNRDEGSYIGFFGKASDAMVDLQIISDIHKSEVYQVAYKLGVPQEIIDEKPSGDVYDNRIDEEMIGAPYWFLEMYLLSKEYWPSISIITEDVPKQLLEISIKNNPRTKFIVLTGSERETFLKYEKNIEDLHNKNAHKYQVGNPAHFIDVMSRKIQGGW